MSFDAVDIAGMVSAFAEEETVTIDFGGRTASVIAIFDDGYLQTTIDGVAVFGRSTRVLVPTDQVEELEVGDCYGRGTRLMVSGNTYAVTSHQPDGSGFSLLMLAREEE